MVGSEELVVIVFHFKELFLGTRVTHDNLNWAATRENLTPHKLEVSDLI